MAAALAAAVLGCATPAAAQQVAWRKDSSPLIIHGAPAPEGELTARQGEPLLAQRLTSLRSVRLDEPAPIGTSATSRTFPAGSGMFGIQAPDGWVYCAVAKSSAGWLFADQSVCYQDVDGDGRFDQMRPSGVPFGAVPLLVHEIGAPKPLPAPVRYSALPWAEGPALDYVVTWKPDRMPKKWGRPAPPICGVKWGGGVRVGEQQLSLGDGPTIRLACGASTTSPPPPIQVFGARIHILGLTPDGEGLRYRVERTMPTQVFRVEMTLFQSTYYYVYTY